MLIEIFSSGPLSTNAYLIACQKTMQAAVIDPAPGSFAKINSYLLEKDFNLTKILLTHSHWDHIADVKAFKERYHLPIYLHGQDEPNLSVPGSDGLVAWLKIAPSSLDHRLEDGMNVTVGSLSFKVIHTPGHSPGSVCFFEPSEGVLFSGDTLFEGTFGRLDLPSSQPNLMKSSLAKLAQLPPSTRVFPGHGNETTIEREKNTFNIF
jgi:hydroxyacylglutathione hydrolase